MKKILMLILVVLLMSVSFVQAETLENADVGSTVIFGNYEQGNGKAPIEWIVLDKQEDCVLMLSRYTLDCKPFHEVEDWNVTWSECSLRSWLNGDFINSAFNEEERARIIPVTNTTVNAPDTQDSVFLLSLDELNTYLPDEESRIAEATEYTVEQGGRVSQTTGNTYWWLRTKAMSDDCIHVVKYDGTTDEFGDSMEAAIYTVRPVIRIDISS